MNKIVIIVIVLIVLLVTLLYINTSEKYNSIVLVENIPKKIIQTYHTPSKVPEHINELRNKYASEYSYSLYDDNQGLEFLKKHYSEEVIKKYNELSGAHKADLLRYCIIYIEGGVYMDIKTMLTRPLHEIIDHSVTNNIRHKLITVKSANAGTIYQGFFATTKNNPFLLKVIQKVLDTSLEESNNYYQLFTTQFYDTVEEFKDQQDTILFTEQCNNSSTNTLDRYGLHCVVKNDNGDKMFDVRDPTYPW